MNAKILKQLFEAYNKIDDWKIIIDNSDKLNELSLINDNRSLHYRLLLDNKMFWLIKDQSNNVLFDKANSISEIVNNLTEKNKNEEFKLMGFCVKNIGRKKPVYVPISNKFISFDDWKKQKKYRWWIPIYLNFSHFKKTKSILERNISSMSGEFEFKPEQVINILSKLLVNIYSINILSEVKKIINYYLNEYPYLGSNIRYSIKSFELFPHNRKKVNDLLQFLVKAIVICNCNRLFLIKFWTEYLARKMQNIYNNLGSRTFKMFYKYWHIDLELMNKYLLPSILYADKLIRFLNNREPKEYNHLRYWLSDYPHKMQYSGDEDEDDRIKKYVRYICVISFKQGYIPFNANHFQKKLKN